MNLVYLLSRLARHLLPENLTRTLLRRGWIIKPGLESSSPELAVERYRQVLDEYGFDLVGKRVLVFGYGGRLNIATELLRSGAKHVVLADKFAPPDEVHNMRLLSTAGEYVQEDGARVVPRAEWITLFQGDVCDAARNQIFAPVDLVLSSSVFEHLPGEEIDAICAALAALTALGGMQVHFIDLRDHFFKYPFEMLTFSERIWRCWLNPTSNLNRFRLGDYRRVFEKHFNRVAIAILERDEIAFARVQSRVRSEFLDPDPSHQAVTLIRVDTSS